MNNKIIPFTLAIVLSLLIGGCKKEKSNNQDSEQQEVAVLNVDNLFDKAEDLTDSDVTVEGVCTHICAHGGGKIFLMGSDDTVTIRVEASESLGSFPQETVGAIVRVNGILKENRIDEAYLLNWEAEVAAKVAEEHGESEAGCAADMQANAEKAANDIAERIENFRTRIAERTEKEGKPYVSLYYIEATSYQIIE